MVQQVPSSVTFTRYLKLSKSIKIKYVFLLLLIELEATARKILSKQEYALIFADMYLKQNENTTDSLSKLPH